MEYVRGSEWRQWDLHIHSPASFHWKGPAFQGDPLSPRNAPVIDQMIDSLNAATPAVFGIMDYWTFDGWLALQKRLKDSDAPLLKKRVFPGIELRLVSPSTCRLNAHVLFSDESDEQILRDFQSRLIVEIVNRPLSDAALVALARKVSEDKLKIHSFNKATVDRDDAVALRAGSTIAEINCDSYKHAIASVPEGKAVGFMPYDTNDGLDRVKWQEHYAYFIGLFQSSPVFETRDPVLRASFVGERIPENAAWFENFQNDLNHVARLAVSGSDAHRFTGAADDNDRRGYGDFPSVKITWIKADPTWQGLLHALKEPAKRSYIGLLPPKLGEISQNKTYFIDQVSVCRDQGSTLADKWLHDCVLPLNPDLVAIIGNKGSGKSALADVIALLGNSRQKEHFSFLKRDRFLGKSGEPAKQFIGKLVWRDKTENECRLSDDPSEDSVELIRYIPQGFFEGLCNAHVARRSNAFEQELRAVIFSHANESIRLGALDFDQLIAKQEGSYRDQLAEARKNLQRLNLEIASIEEQLQPDMKSSLTQLFLLKQKQIEEHYKIPPAPFDKPSERLTEEQEKSAAELELIAAKLVDNEKKSVDNIASSKEMAAKLKAIQNIRERLRLLDRQFQQFQNDTETDFLALGLPSSQVATLAITAQPLDALSVGILQQQQDLSLSSNQLSGVRQNLVEQQIALNTKLNEPQLRYQQYLKDLQLWEEKLRDLMGSPESPETLKGIEARIAQLDQLPVALKEKEEQRLRLTEEIFDILESQRASREQLFKPVQDLIQENVLIRDEYKLRFQATLGGSPDIFASSLFDLIKQNTGEFSGQDESYSTIRKAFEPFDLNRRKDVRELVAAVHRKINAVARASNRSAVGIASLLRKDRAAVDVYDLIFGLTFLEPRYTLLFQETPIEQLSPGQRGALLLIFYLLVDKGRNPIVLDQPEENLDNETVVSLLVPVLTEAKKRRQIIMVTHNPNLAVVCDAEQVIYSSFDRKNGYCINYLAGSIENPEINQHVVNVLEGTMPAFNNRGGKYF